MSKHIFDGEFLQRVDQTAIRRRETAAAERARERRQRGENSPPSITRDPYPSIETARQARRVLAIAQDVAEVAVARSVSFNLECTYQKTIAVNKRFKSTIQRAAGPTQHVVSAWELSSTSKRHTDSPLSDGGKSWILQKTREWNTYNITYLASNGALFVYKGDYKPKNIRLNGKEDYPSTELLTSMGFASLTLTNAADDLSEPIPPSKFRYPGLQGYHEYHLPGLPDSQAFLENETYPVKGSYWGFHRMEQCLAEFVAAHQLDRSA